MDQLGCTASALALPRSRSPKDTRFRMLALSSLVLGLGICILAISSCAVPRLLTEPIVWLELVGHRGPFDVDAHGPDARLDGKVLQRVRASPVGYFRFVNTVFASEVCRRFGAHLSATPVVNLHGDAHLEQYAVTDTGRGLTDFDDAAMGPVVLDLVRFSTSLVLACRERGWNDEVERALHDFSSGTWLFREPLWRSCE